MKNLFAFILVFFALVANSQSNNNIRLMTTSTTPNTTAAAVIVAPINDPNVLKFTYDMAGNQTKREFIYIASGIWRPGNPNNVAPAAAEKVLTPSDLYADILYYPNPVLSELFVKWKNSDDNFVEKIELYSFSGQLLTSIPALKNNEEATVDFDSLPSGYYYMVMMYNSGDNKDLKIIKK